MMKTYQVLALSGSLRAGSLNTALLHMASACAPQGLCVSVFDAMGALPLFNPDLEAHEPAAVAYLRSAVAKSDAVLIASPEYAHGVSGVMKNALDWLVASGVFVDKPVVLWNASPRASLALAALRETLTVMSARMVGGSVALELLVKPAEPGQAIHNPDPTAIQQALQSLYQALQPIQTPEASV
jgi:chromate reductase